MTRLLRIFALLMAASMLLWIAGCGGDEEEVDKGPAPSVTSVSVASGQEVASNSTITVSFSKKMNAATVSITLNGTPAAVTAGPAGKTFTFTPGAALEGQSVTLAIQGQDDFKQALDPAYTPITFTVKAEDKVAPTIVDSGCVPPNKATGVDPAGVIDMVIKFSETMGTVTVTAKDPDFKSVDKLVGDTLTVTFLQFSLSNETTYSLTLSGTDAAGNALTTTAYSFTTMAKE